MTTYTAYGVDDTGGLSGATLKASTIDGHAVAFAARYLSGFSKDLGVSEARDLSAHSIAIVCVWETTATRAESGHAAGVADARAALAEANSRGMPAGRPIYFAVDEDTTAGPNVRSYFQGVNSVLGVARTGCYGGYKVVSGLFGAGLIAWGWQTYAWSGGQWDNRAQLEQYSNNHILHGVGVDYDRALTTDYGQWRIGWTPSPQPIPTPQEDDMAAAVSLGGGVGQVPAGGNISIGWGHENSDKHAWVAASSDGKAYSIYPDGPYWLVGSAWFKITGLKAGDALDLAWSLMTKDAKGAWVVAKDSWRVKVRGDGSDPQEFQLSGQLGVTKDTPVRVRVYNPNGYAVNVAAAVAEATFLKY